MPKAVMAIKLNAGNDANGNPRRVYLVMSELAQIIEAIDDDYMGDSAVTSKYPGLPISNTVTTTPKEYRNCLKHYRK